MTQQEVIDWLQSKGASLCGSRYFMQREDWDHIVPGSTLLGHGEGDSDWDFCYQNGTISDEEIFNAGFKVLLTRHAPYLDDLALAIYQHESHPVQLVCRSDSRRYMQILSCISTQFYYNFLWKRSASVLEKYGSQPRSIGNNIQAIFNQLFKV